MVEFSLLVPLFCGASLFGSSTCTLSSMVQLYIFSVVHTTRVSSWRAARRSSRDLVSAHISRSFCMSKSALKDSASSARRLRCSSSTVSVM